MVSSKRVPVILAAIVLASCTPATDAAKNMRGGPSKIQPEIVPNNVPYKKRCPMKAALAQSGTASVKDESGDKGMWAAQMEYDQLRGKLRKEKKDGEETLANKVNASMTLRVPGTGMVPEEIKAEFAAGTIYKDGFYKMGCIKDYMYYKGDKFGDNKYDYEQEKISNVSIVFPLSYVAKEDQELMTVKYCYSMCRQLKNMNFFGIVNGLDCYCSPFVEAMAGDDSTCTAVCDGEKGEICGSKTKSSIFQMHSCDNTVAQLEASLELATNLLDELQTANLFKMASSLVSSEADEMKAAFGKVGDPEVSNLFQDSETLGSDLGIIGKKVMALHDKIAATVVDGGAMKTEDFSLYETAAKADTIIATIAEEAITAEKYLLEMEEKGKKTVPGVVPEIVKMAANAAEQYYPIMYFEDKKFEEFPTSCSGKLMDIYLGTSKDVCAKACDLTDTEGCIGFLYVPGVPHAMGPMPGSFCFTFSAITSIQYYTSEKCAPSEVMCYGKLSKLSGTTPLDKEKQQKAVEADSRCMPVTDQSRKKKEE